MLPSFARQNGFHDAGKLCGSGDGCLGTGFHYGAGNGAGSAFLAELPEDICDFFFRGLIHQVPGGESGAGIHPHVQRAVFPKGKAAGGGVKLVGGNAQVRQQPVHPGNPLLGKNAFHVLEVAGEHFETGTEARQPEHGGAAGVRIAVNAPDGGALFQQKFRMAAAAKRAVHDEFAGARFQHVHRLMQQNGNVTEAVSGDGAVRFRVNSGNGVIPQFGNQGVHPGRGFPGFQGFRVVRGFPVHGGGQGFP